MNNKSKYGFLFLLLLFIYNPGVKATHNRAGEITFKHLYGNTYEITIITYTNTKPTSDNIKPADNPYLEVNWGDGTVSSVDRIEWIDLPDYYRRNKYVQEHTFPAPGVYEIVMQNPYRNEGVKNIPNPLGTMFTIKTTLIINNALGHNQAPKLLYPPTDKAAKGITFIHNPVAFDPDGDSLSYKLVQSKGTSGEDILGYEYPPATNSLYVDEVTGDLVWDAPKNTGTYNVAMEIYEWRNGVKISSILRDIQITVVETDNLPPEVEDVSDYCVVAGDTLEFEIRCTDPDDDAIEDTIYGGPFEVSNPAKYSDLETRNGLIRSVFRWETKCNHIKKQPYNVTVKVAELYENPRLFDLEHFLITVIGPAPKNPAVEAAQNDFFISWEPPNCENQVVAYEVYRKVLPTRDTNTTPYCCIGIPPDWGYELIYTTDSASTLSHLDKNIKRGFQYCYRIVAIYNEINNTRGKPSSPVCATLPPGTPAFIKTSVEKDDSISGVINIAWLRPDYLIDSISGPFQFRMYRKSPNDSSFSLIKIWESPTINDTTYIDSMVNTLIFPYDYQLELYSIDFDTVVQVGFSEKTSSTYLSYDGNDNKVTLFVNSEAPWIDTAHVVYKYNETFARFDSIGITYNGQFIDSGLVNFKWQQYKMRSYGWRRYDSTTFYTNNLSHLLSAMPVDTIPPCPPQIRVSSNCIELYNTIWWEKEEKNCTEDITKYYLYYSPSPDAGGMVFLDSISIATLSQFSYQHYPEIAMGACYGVTALDSFNNESSFLAIGCIDSCKYYKLPNVFTPNDDNEYDYFSAENKNDFVKRVDMKIYNRYGTLVFETENPKIEWDGRDMNSKRLLPSGVYYYVCVVYEPRLNGKLEPRTLTGFIHLFTNKNRINTE